MIITILNTWYIKRVPLDTYRRQGRNTPGVRIMRLDSDDRAVAVARIGGLRDYEGEGPDAGGEEYAVFFRSITTR